MEHLRLGLAIVTFVTGFFSLGYGQNHVDTTGTVSCYSCHGDHSGFQSFAQCLGVTPITCPSGQSCRISYTKDWHDLPTISCSSSCPSFDQASSTQCPYGGHRERLGTRCNLCCTDDACVNNVTSRLMEAAPVICPNTHGHDCSLSNPDGCWEDVKVCESDRFCEMTVRHGEIKGSCRDNHNLANCLGNKDTDACAVGNSDDCTVDCCWDNECIARHFGGVYANVAVDTTPVTTSTTTTPTTPVPTTSTTTTTTAATTTATTAAATTVAPYGIYAELVQECLDHLEPGLCKDLKETQDLCKSNGTGLHLELCPDTCGVCQAIKEANCHDAVVGVMCSELIETNDICNDPLGRFTCPVTCGFCDILVEDKLAAILSARNDSAMVTPAMADV